MQFNSKQEKSLEICKSFLVHFVRCFIQKKLNIQQKEQNPNFQPKYIHRNSMQSCNPRSNAKINIKDFILALIIVTLE